MFHKEKTPRIARISLIIFMGVICGISEQAWAQRKNNFGIGVDFMAGATNQAGTSSSARGQAISAFYSVYPSVELLSAGEHSRIGLQYTMVGERFEMQPMIKTTSHAFNGSFSAQLGTGTRLRLSDSLNTAPSYSTLNVLKGILPTPGGYQYVFEPQLYSRSQLSNSASLGLDIDLTNKSYLTIGASGSLRHYLSQKEDTARNSSLADQLRMQGDFGYSRKQTDHTTWTVKYSVWQNYYENFEHRRAHSATIGFSYKLTPTVQLDASAGPSYTERGSASYVANVTLSRQLEINRFTAGYAHRSSDSTGLGDSTDSDQGMLAFSQRLGRNTSLNFQATAFHQSLYDYWGVNGAASLARQLGRYCVLQIGSSYNGYRDYNSKRFYISFGIRKKATDYTDYTD